MTKPKKLTYNELANYIIMLENKFTQTITIIGQTLTDYIEMTGHSKKFKSHLKKKYAKKETE